MKSAYLVCLILSLAHEINCSKCYESKYMLDYQVMSTRKIVQYEDIVDCPAGCFVVFVEVNGEDGKFQGCADAENSNSTSCVKHFQQLFRIPDDVTTTCLVCSENLCNGGERNSIGFIFFLLIFVKKWVL
ncbi:hypothetical protein ACFFRR_000192 [Megaselia abdita]